jgi:hypothetical protein
MKFGSSMSVRSRSLPVPYFTQPTGITCQSTVLKMMAAYIEGSILLQSSGAADRAIEDIWSDINESEARPVKARNAHANMKWWLEQHFPSLRFTYLQTKDEAHALDKIVQFIDGGFPVVVSVSHSRSDGHIVLVVGYANYAPCVSSPDFALIVHDPNGEFDPVLLSKMFGKGRNRTGGVSLADGGEIAPGRANRLPVTAVSRRRAGDSRVGTYYLLSASSK